MASCINEATLHSATDTLSGNATGLSPLGKDKRPHRLGNSVAATVAKYKRRRRIVFDRIISSNVW